MTGEGATVVELPDVPERRLRLVFFMRHQVYTRNFESTLRMLAERGHSVHVGFDRTQTDPPGAPIRAELIQRLSREYPDRITYGRVPWRREGAWNLESGWFRLEAEVGRARDYLRYLDPRYDHAPKLRRRGQKKAGGGIGRLARLPLVRTPAGLRRLGSALAWVERELPTRTAVNAFLEEQNPDVILLTPLIDIGSPQGAYVRSAKGLGRRTILCVHSWDNLTNKGLIRDAPDLVTVWNRAQVREAVEMHGIPEGQVLATGAPGYDHWFEWGPSREREELCRTVGLPADRPIVLYLCSSIFIAPDEHEWIERWLEHLRSEGPPELREAAVLVRPHPKNVEQWGGVDLSHLGPVAVWPRTGADPLSREAKADFYDSMYHCAAVVGVNTSALIESAIVGRPVHTVLAPQFRDTQTGTLHFQHLMREGGGMLNLADSLGEHFEQLAAALCDEGRGIAAGRRFVETFVRPRGIDRPATPQLVAEVERRAAAPAPAPRTAGPATNLLRAALAPAALLLALRPAHHAYVTSIWLRWRWHKLRGDEAAAATLAGAPPPGEPGPPQPPGGRNGAEAEGLPPTPAPELGDPVGR